MAEEFILAMRASTNRNGVPYAEGTLTAYRDAVVALDAWMTRERIAGDFTVCDATLLNRFFATICASTARAG